MRIHIVPGDIKRFSAAFHDFECVDCLEHFEEGDPIGYVDGDGPMCDDCIRAVGTKTQINVQK
jgi:hypothetical protein